MILSVYGTRENAPCLREGGHHVCSRELGRARTKRITWPSNGCVMVFVIISISIVVILYILPEPFLHQLFYPSLTKLGQNADNDEF